MVAGIYKITNLITNLFYIGHAKDIELRWKSHESTLNRNIHDNSYLQAAWNKYGAENFEFVAIEGVEDLDKLIEREQYWINLTQCYKRHIGYNLNINASGVLGLKWSKSSREKLSLAKKGFKASAETRAKMSVVQKARGPYHSSLLKGRKQSEEWKNKKALAARKLNKWPCEDGRKCKCKVCMNTRRLDQQKYRAKLRESSGW